MIDNNRFNLTYFAVIVNIFFVPLLYFKTYLGPIPLSIEVFSIPLLVVCFVIDYLKKNITLNDFPIKGITIAFLLYTVVSIFSLFGAKSLITGVMELARFLSYVFLFLIIVKVHFSRHQYKIFSLVFLLSITLVGLFGVAQYVFDFSLNQNGMYAIPEAKGRVASTFINPNYYSAFINLVLPGLLLFAVLYFKDRLGQILLFLLYSLLVLNLILTYTRASWVIMAGGLVLLLLTIGKPFLKNFFKPHFIILTVILAVSVYNLPGVENRMVSAAVALKGTLFPSSMENSAEEDPVENETVEKHNEKEKVKEITNVAVVSRTVLWKTGLIMFKENPVLGVGLGNYLVNYNDVVSRNPELDLGHEEGYSVHNSFIKVMAETGTIGILAFLSIYVIYFLKLVRYYFAYPHMRLYTVSLFIGSVTFMMQNMTNNLIFIPQSNIMFWLIAAVGLNFIKSYGPEKTDFA